VRMAAATLLAFQIPSVGALKDGRRFEKKLRKCGARNMGIAEEGTQLTRGELSALKIRT
jgi:hypothetical protein